MFFYEEVRTIMKNVHGQYIWIIGASTGIGAALAIELSKQGANLILSARRSEQLETVSHQLIGKNHQIIDFDVSDYAQTCEAAKKIKRLDRVIFLAAVYDTSNNTQPDVSFIQQSLQVNLGGVYHMLDVVKPFFESQGHGQINLCASVAGYFGLPNSQPYASTKAAIINLAESLYVECLPKNIDVKVINPGFVKTPLTDKNDFEMPMIISANKAAVSIARGLQSSAFEIHFPKKFTLLLKLLRLLPYGLAFKISQRFT